MWSEGVYGRRTLYCWSSYTCKAVWYECPAVYSFIKGFYFLLLYEPVPGSSRCVLAPPPASRRGFPIKRSTFTRYAEILAAPALRRLGRAGLEAPPLRGQKNLSF